MPFSFLDSSSPSQSLRELPLSVVPSRLEHTSVTQLVTNTTSQTLGSNDGKENDSCVETNDPNSEKSKNPAEFFISSDGSAILGHTNRVIYLEVIWYL